MVGDGTVPEAACLRTLHLIVCVVVAFVVVLVMFVIVCYIAQSEFIIKD